jgi:hypothetical protein
VPVLCFHQLRDFRPDDSAYDHMIFTPPPVLPPSCTGLTKRRPAERPRPSRTITALARLAVALICARRLTAYRYLHVGIDALTAAAPGLSGALLAARAAGDAHVTVDGTLIRTDRVRAPGPTARGDRAGARVDLWWSGKHTAHGGNVQVIAAPDGWPIWTSEVRPGREHDTTALRAHTEALPLLAAWTDTDHAVLADLGYEGERGALTTPVKTTAGRRLTDDERTVNLLHAATRAPAERGNSLLKTTFKALRRVSLCPWRIGAVTAAALVLLHHVHGRTT